MGMIYISGMRQLNRARTIYRDKEDTQRDKCEKRGGLKILI